MPREVAIIIDRRFDDLLSIVFKIVTEETERILQRVIQTYNERSFFSMIYSGFPDINLPKMVYNTLTLSREEKTRRMRQAKLLEVVKIDLSLRKNNNNGVKNLMSSLFPLVVERVFQEIEELPRDSNESEVRDTIHVEARKHLKQALEQCYDSY